MISFKEALWLSGFWIAVAPVFGASVWFFGRSFDRWRVVSISGQRIRVAQIFSTFTVPEEHRYHVLFWGVMVAIVFRAIFLSRHRLALGLLLARLRNLPRLHGIAHAARQSNPEHNSVLRLFRHPLPTTKSYHSDGRSCRRVVSASSLPACKGEGRWSVGWSRRTCGSPTPP